MADRQSSQRKHTRQSRQRKHTAMLLLLAVGMFGFAFALVPLYEVFCELTGLNGRTSGRPAAAGQVSDVSDREVTIQFAAHVSRGMPWEFRPTENQLQVRVGEIHTTHYYVRNRAAGAVTGQAVPSVAPGFAAPHLHKIECFCFTQQRLEGGGEMRMPVQFYVGADLPEGVETLSLSYSLFRVEDAAGEKSNNPSPVPSSPSSHHEEHPGS